MAEQPQNLQNLKNPFKEGWCLPSSRVFGAMRVSFESSYTYFDVKFRFSLEDDRNAVKFVAWFITHVSFSGVCRH